jgi:hypothetical protein
MGDDIVERLRFIVPIHEGRRGHDCIAAAADEIERLRREVDDLRIYIRMSAINGLRMVGLTTKEDDRG